MCQQTSRPTCRLLMAARIHQSIRISRRVQTDRRQRSKIIQRQQQMGPQLRSQIREATRGLRTCLPPSANTSANTNQPVRTDRPPSAQQNNPSVGSQLKDPRIDAYRGRPNQQQAPAQAAVPPQATQARPAAPQADRPAVAPVQARPTPQVTPPVERNTRPTPEVRAPAPPPNNPAPRPRMQPAQAPSRQVDSPPTSAFKVNKSPIDTNAASQRGQASRTQAVQPQPQQQAKPLPRAANQPQSNKPAHPSPEKRQ